MKTRILGSQGLVVSEIGLGCMGMGHAVCPITAVENQYSMM